MKKRKIGLYGTCFGEDLSKIRRFEDLGMEDARGEALAAQQHWFRRYWVGERVQRRPRSARGAGRLGDSVPGGAETVPCAALDRRSPVA